jgi:hypothetical protein
MITRLIPKIFFDNMSDGFDLFIDGLGFKVLHHAGSLAVVERDGAKAYIVESAEYAAKDRPEIALETNNINDLYAEISSRRPDLLHPNSRHVTTKPWGAQEFALLDKTGVCVIFRQWQ